MVLLACAAIAMIWANSPWSDSYFQLLDTPLSFALGTSQFSMSLHAWVNEGLMMAFFLLIGLEVKEQVLVGELSSIKGAMLPICAAIGGMIVPAIIYTLVNQGGEGITGWGVPMSTDIAFALGILALLGKRVPLSLKVFLATLAIADDLGAILVITLFYSGQIMIGGLIVAALCWLVLFLLGRIGIYNPLLTLLLSIGVWLGFLSSGIHATIAGVIVAIAIPARPLINPHEVLHAIKEHLPHTHGGHDVLRDKEQRESLKELNDAMSSVAPPLVQLEASLQPVVTFLIMPLFALFNAGVVINNVGNLGEALTSTVGLGVILGLVIGKPVGITLASWLAVKFGLARLPSDLRWAHLQGVSILAGIGFTMSLFVTELAFLGNHHLAETAKLGILAASFTAGIIGYGVLSRITHVKESKPVMPVITPKPITQDA
ncbi:MAG: Na+/H+ antiporter NhaA [Anaerolineae bacterium]|nr:Na+/H+ antiporter NhaA [Anaerolineae bacterium]